MTNTITIKRGRGRPRKTADKTDWEKLAKRLQQALESSVKENRELTENKAKIIGLAHELEKQVVGLEAVIQLLEKKLDRANYSV